MAIVWKTGKFMSRCELLVEQPWEDTESGENYRHDEMAVNAGQRRPPFIDIHDELTTTMQKKLLEYAKTLLDPTDTGSGTQGGAPQAMQSSTQPSPTEGGADSGKSGRSGRSGRFKKRVGHLSLETEDGYPVMPVVGATDLKEDLEDLLRGYLAAQYSKSALIGVRHLWLKRRVELASGCRKDRVPFSTVQANVRQFIDPKYHPKDFKFEDPRNIKKDIIIKFCCHVRERQEKHGVSEAFRFLRYQNGKERAPAEYGVRAEEERAAVKAQKQKQIREARVIAQKDRAANKRGKQKGPNRNSTPEPCGTHGPGTGVIDGNPVMVIDPALLLTGDDSPNPINGTRVGHAMVPGVMPEMVLIGANEMQKLHSTGYPSTIPVNGPGDGPPMYAVPASAQRILDEVRTQTQTECPRNAETNVPQPITPRGKRKRSRNADTRTIEEAEKLLVSTRTRGKRTTRHR